VETGGRIRDMTEKLIGEIFSTRGQGTRNHDLVCETVATCAKCLKLDRPKQYSAAKLLHVVSLNVCNWH